MTIVALGNQYQECVPSEKTTQFLFLNLSFVEETVVVIRQNFFYLYLTFKYFFPFGRHRSSYLFLFLFICFHFACLVTCCVSSFANSTGSQAAVFYTKKLAMYAKKFNSSLIVKSFLESHESGHYGITQWSLQLTTYFMIHLLLDIKETFQHFGNLFI